MMEIKDVVAQANLGNVLRHYGVRKGGGESSWYCPFHEDSSPSFIAQPEGHRWKCPKCELSGDEIEFIQKIDHLDKAEAVNKLKDLCGIIDVYLPKFDELKPLYEQHKKFLLSRGIDPGRAEEKFGLKSRTKTYKKKDDKTGEYFQYKSFQICFPEPDEIGRIRSFKYIDTHDKGYQGVEGDYRDTKTYPQPNYEGIKRVIFVAGHWDLLIFDQEFEKEYKSNVYDSTAIRTFSSGEKNIAKDISLLVKYPDIENVCIFYDNDDSGIKGSKNLAKAIQKLGINAIVKFWPKEFKSGFDSNDWLFLDKNNHGTIKQMLDNEGEVYEKIIEAPKITDDQTKDILDLLYKDSEKYQKSILTYLLSDNDSIGVTRMNLEPNNFLNLKYRRYYNVINDRFVKIGVCDIDKFIEIEPDAMKDLISPEIEIRNIDELKENIEKVKSFYFRNLVFNHFRDMEFLVNNMNSMLDKEIHGKVLESLDRVNNTTFSGNVKKNVIMYDVMQDHINNPEPIVEMLGMPVYNILTTYLGGGLPYGKMSIIAARPSVGKTTFMVNLIEELAESALVGIYSLEMKANELARISFALNSDFSLSAITNSYDEGFINTLKRSPKEKHKNIHIFTGYKEPLEIAHDIEMKNRRLGMRIFFIDHFHMMTVDPKFRDPRQFYNYWSTYFAHLADRLGIMIVLLCQLNRNTESRGSAQPKLSDLKETGNLEQDAYNIIFLFADDANKQQSSEYVNAAIAKARGGTAGVIVPFRYNRNRGRFMEQEMAA